MTELEKQINLVVEVRAKTTDTIQQRVKSLEEWQEANKGLYDQEAEAKIQLSEAEATLREMALVAFGETGEKQVAPGIGIRVRTILNYGGKDAMDWALEHKLALKLDGSAFEKIAKTSNLSFVTITEEPQATIATELKEIT
ncbi:hypothetical protein LCGC14_0970940 [marine sediment metagenome]|uniref:Uncharacterized protein n=1 Tax=marine sediment metagenome TaxID=412755 RepID=A0A0F9QUW0_9ZZZZ